jgi:CubicO group peptidase (beta-lactamase class C family)
MAIVFRQTLEILLLALIFAGALPASAQEEAARFARAYERIDALVAQHMRANGTPGVALAVTSREGLLRVETYGYADIKSRRPVTPETLFEIGSISKSFTAICLLQLREEGKIDLQQPVTKYLPWFSVQSRFEPITVHHLLTHTSGLPRDRDDIPSSLFQAAALSERETGYAAGKKIHIRISASKYSATCSGRSKVSHPMTSCAAASSSR